MTLIINEMSETQWNCCCIKAIGILANDANDANDASSDRTEYVCLFEAPNSPSVAESYELLFRIKI